MTRGKVPRTWAGRRKAPFLLTLWMATVGCRFEPLEELASYDPPPPSPPSEPTIPRSDPGAQPAVGWESMVRQHLNFLAGPLAAGRRPGTDGAMLSQRIAMANFSEAGLTPDGIDRAWTQPVQVDIASNHRVQLSTKLTGNDQEEASSITLDAGIYVRRDGRAAEFDASMRVFSVHASRLLDTPVSLPAEAMGKLVVAKAPSKQTWSTPEYLEHARAFFAAARTAGAAGCLLALPQGEGRPLIVEQWTQPEVRRHPDAADLSTPSTLAFHGFIDSAVLDVLEAAAEAGASVRVKLESQARAIEDNNVIGRIPGEEDPSHVVVVLAHWDAGGLSPPLPRGGAAIRNGTGVAALFAIAEISGRWFALGRRPRRSLVFAATAAGSLGHLGARTLINLPGLEPRNIVAVINLEDLDWRSPQLQAIDGGHSTLGELMAELEPTAITTIAEEPWGHTPFLEQGLAAMTLHRDVQSTPLGSPEEWGSLEVLARDAELAFRLAWELAERATTPIVSPAP